MNLLLLSPAELRGEHAACIEAARYPPRAGLWPPAPGRVLRAGLRNGRLGSARVERVEDGRVHLALALAEDPPPPLPITLLLALPRPKMLRRVLRSVTELGIKHVVLLNSSRVEKSYWSSPLLAPERLEAYLLAGLEQAGDSVLPAVRLRPRLRPFVEDELPALAAGSHCLVAHPGAATIAPRALDGALTLAIGPEGGFTGFELGLLVTAGFTPVALGTRILRVETAVPALVAALGRLDAPAGPGAGANSPAAAV